MGDLLLTLPAVHAIRQGFPSARVTLLIQEGLRPLLEGHPDIDELWTTPPHRSRSWIDAARWRGRLRKEQFDAVVIFNPTGTFHLAAFLAGIPLRVGYDRKLGFLLTRRIPDTKAARKLHESEYNLELVRLLGNAPDEPAMTLPVSDAADRLARRLLESHGVSSSQWPVAIHPWTSNPAKSWPLNSFLEVAHRLSRAGEAVLLIGEPGDAASMETAGLIDLIGKIPLGTLPALLKRCRLLVSNDSGPAHVAAAVGTPTLVVAPREHEPVLRRWRPLGTNVRILLSPSPSEVESACAALPA